MTNAPGLNPEQIAAMNEAIVAATLERLLQERPDHEPAEEQEVPE